MKAANHVLFATATCALALAMLTACSGSTQNPSTTAAPSSATTSSSTNSGTDSSDSDINSIIVSSSSSSASSSSSSTSTPTANATATAALIGEIKTAEGASTNIDDKANTIASTVLNSYLEALASGSTMSDYELSDAIAKELSGVTWRSYGFKNPTNNKDEAISYAEIFLWADSVGTAAADYNGETYYFVFYYDTKTFSKPKEAEITAINSALSAAGISSLTESDTLNSRARTVADDFISISKKYGSDASDYEAAITQYSEKLVNNHLIPLVSYDASTMASDFASQIKRSKEQLESEGKTVTFSEIGYTAVTKDNKTMFIGVVSYTAS